MIYSIVGTVLFSVWLLLTLLRNLDLLDAVYRRAPLLASLDGLVPIWSFFAPTPGTADYVLLKRYSSGGSWGPWMATISTLRRVSPWAQAVWNPEKTTSKALLDMVNDLIQWRSQEGISLSVSYLAVLSHLCKQPTPVGVDRIQFAVASIDRSGTNVLMASEPHRLTGAV